VKKGRREAAMVDVGQLAAETVRILSLALPAAKLMAGKAEEGFAGEAGKKLLAWLTERMTAPVAKETLARAMAEPEKPRNITALQGEIEGMAEEDPDFRSELEKRVQEAGGSLKIQNATTRAMGTGRFR
jgi:hypothetical protein